MNPEFWISHWNENKIGFHQAQINERLMRFYPQLEMKGGDCIFVPLCGKSHDMVWLREQGLEVIGVELSGRAVTMFFEEHALEPEIDGDARFIRYSANGIELLQGDFFAVKKSDLRGATGVYDRAALVALPPAMRLKYAQRMASLFPSGSRMLLLTIEYPEGEIQGPPFTVPEEEVEKIYGESFTITRLASKDILDDEPRFRQRGITQMTEKVFLLVRR